MSEDKAVNKSGSDGSKPVSSWSEEKLKMLRHYWCDTDLSAQKIAQVMGNGITRNAIIGKANRMKLRRASVPKTAKTTIKTSTRTTTKALHTPKIGKMGAVVPFMRHSVDGIEQLNVFQEEYRQLFQNCQWPEGDPTESTVLCNEKVVGSTAYCHKHEQWAYIKSKHE